MKSFLVQCTHRPAASHALWLVRWMLVLILVWDQASAPLHHHRHDSGVDATHLIQAHQVDDGELTSITHGVQAVRFQNRGVFEEYNAGDHVWAAAVVALLLPPEPVRHALPAYPRPPRSDDDLNLRPEGRAPPFHG